MPIYQTLRRSTQDNPLSQAEILNYVKIHRSEVFEVAKVSIDVQLTKAKGGELVETNVLARDGRKIEETKNTAKEGQAIDTRHTISGEKDQYAKKPEKVAGLYEIEGGRSYDEVEPGETVKAKTVGGEHRQAIVATTDMYLDTTWGKVQFVAKGGLITISGNEAIGNNNPCDMVLVVDGKQSNVVMTEPVYKQRKDLEAQGAKLTPAVEGFFAIAAEEDRKNPYMGRTQAQVMSFDEKYANWSKESGKGITELYGEDLTKRLLRDAKTVYETLKTSKAIEDFVEADYRKQNEMVKGLDEGHSGLSFSIVCRLALDYAKYRESHTSVQTRSKQSDGRE